MYAPSILSNLMLRRALRQRFASARHRCFCATARQHATDSKGCPLVSNDIAKHETVPSTTSTIGTSPLHPLHQELLKRQVIQDVTPGFLPHGASIYAGCDPTAQSLHIGNLAVLVTLFRFQLAGFNTIGLVGGATGWVGDPSGKTAERTALTNEQLETNKASITDQLHLLQSNMLQYARRRDLIRDTIGTWQQKDNLDWFQDLSAIAFVRDIGKHVRMTTMLHRDSIKQRLQAGGDGMSFTEFAYQLFQAYDWVHLAKTASCFGQLGGSDQWGNIIGGVDLIERMSSAPHRAFGMTIPLLTDGKGKKIGKSVGGGGGLWLSADQLHPFDFYQRLRQVDDVAVKRLLLTLTFLSPKEIDEIMSRNVKEPTVAQDILAAEVTELVHGKEAADHAHYLSDFFFRRSADIERARQEISVQALKTFPRRTVCSATSTLLLSDVLLQHQLASSRNEARRLMQAGAVTIGETCIKKDFALADRARLQMEELYDATSPQGVSFGIVRVGKKNLIALIEYTF